MNIRVKVDGNIIFLPDTTNGNWVQWVGRPWACELPFINLDTGDDPNSFTMSMWVKRCEK